MAKGKVDMLDLAAYPIFTLGTLISLEIITGLQLGGFNPADPLVTLGPSTEIATSDLMAIFALGVVIWTNKPQLDPYGGVQSWIIIVTAALVVFTPFVPFISHITSSVLFAGIVAFLIQSTGYMFASFLG